MCITTITITITITITTTTTAMIIRSYRSSSQSGFELSLSLLHLLAAKLAVDGSTGLFFFCIFCCCSRQFLFYSLTTSYSYWHLLSTAAATADDAEADDVVEAPVLRTHEQTALTEGHCQS